MALKVNDFYNNVTIQMQGDDQTPVADELIKKSVFMQAAFLLNRGRIVGPAVDEFNKEKLGHLWSDLLPMDGKYTFAIATVLPYYLPDFDDAPEYSVNIGDTELIVSSRMLQCYFSSDEKHHDPLQYYLVHRRGVPSLIKQKSLINVHPLPLRTFVATQFTMPGTSAEDIIQNHFNSWTNQFVTTLSRFVDSIRAASPQSAKHLLPQVSTPFLSIFWVYASGADNKHGIEQFAGDMPSAAFRSLSKLDKHAVIKARTFLANHEAIPVDESALALARTYLHYGYYGQAIVQVTVACESVLSKAYESYLVSRGVSRKKYEDAAHDITFSQLLNLHLAAVRDLRFLYDKESVLSRLNWARKCRNDFVHKGRFDQIVEAGQVEESIEAADRLIRFLR